MPDRATRGPPARARRLRIPGDSIALPCPLRSVLRDSSFGARYSRPEAHLRIAAARASRERFLNRAAHRTPSCAPRARRRPGHDRRAGRHREAPEARGAAFRPDPGAEEVALPERNLPHDTPDPGRGEASRVRAGRRPGRYEDEQGRRCTARQGLEYRCRRPHRDGRRSRRVGTHRRLAPSHDQGTPVASSGMTTSRPRSLSAATDGAVGAGRSREGKRLHGLQRAAEAAFPDLVVRGEHRRQVARHLRDHDRVLREVPPVRVDEPGARADAVADDAVARLRHDHVDGAHHVRVVEARRLERPARRDGARSPARRRRRPGLSRRTW